MKHLERFDDSLSQFPFDPHMSVGSEIFIIACLIFVNGLLAMSEIALVSARKMRLATLAEQGDKGAKSALRLMESPEEFFSAVQVGITVIGILAGAFGGARLAGRLVPYLQDLPWLADYAEPASLLIVVAIITFFSLVIGEIVPKRLALQSPETIAAAVAAPLARLAKLSLPLVKLLSWTSSLILRLLRTDTRAEPHVTEEEVRAMIGEATISGTVLEAEQQMLTGVFELGDLKVRNVMTPRTQMVALDFQAPLEANIQKTIEAPHSRFPVFDTNMDNIVGVVTIKSLWASTNAGATWDLSSVINKPYFLTETTSALKALEQMKKAGEQLAVVVDEHGGVEGIVTLGDLLDSIVGDFPVPHDLTEESEIVQRADGSYLVSGMLAVGDFKDLMGIKALPDEEDFHTVAGFIISFTGRIPKTGDTFVWNRITFEIVDMDGKRVDKVLVKRRRPKQRSAPRTPS